VRKLLFVANPNMMQKNGNIFNVDSSLFFR